ncbi:unnamed protein product, partial [Didymodactylos carnosus]
MQLNSATGKATSYLEPNDEDVAICAHQLVNGALALDNFRPIRELEKLKADGDRALETTLFSSPDEKNLTISLQRNTNAWIETAKDCLSVVINLSGLVNTCGPAIQAGVLTPADVSRAIQHAQSIGESSKRIYERASDMAVDNSNQLLAAIESRENASQDLTVKMAVEKHRNDLKRFQQGEVTVNVPHQSHAELLESIQKSGLNQEPNVRQKADQSERAWNIAKAVGT